MKLSVKYFKVLKYVYNNQYVNYKNVKNKFANLNINEIVECLHSQKYIEYTDYLNSADDDGCTQVWLSEKVNLKTLPDGDVEIESDRHENLKWKIPLIISIVALAKSFFPEIILIVELLLTLLKQ